MIRFLKILLTLLIFSNQLVAQSAKKKDVKAIKEMCGCYEVRFNFAETFSPNKDYEFHKNYSSGALEYVIPVEESKNKIVLQHLLVIGDTMIIKHWRQDWLYENTDLYEFQKDNTWQYVSYSKAEVKGQWTQKVFQVDDSPRYEGSGSWVHQDGKHYWEAYADAPLPRREFSKRSDYNVMVRRNRQEITKEGWVHEQDNDKVLRNEQDQLIAQEKGMNTYKKVSENKCQIAKDWWQQNQLYWSGVRNAWDEIFAQKEKIKLNMKVDDKILFMRMFELGDQFGGISNDAEAMKTKIKEAISKHLDNKQLIGLKQ